MWQKSISIVANILYFSRRQNVVWRPNGPPLQEKFDLCTPRKNLRALNPNLHIHVSVSDLYSPIYVFSSSRIGRPTAGIYKSLTET
jgi:hypothetical protein